MPLGFTNASGTAGRRLYREIAAGMAVGLILGGAGGAVAHDDTQTGNDNANNLAGHVHRDTINGRGGGDTILGFEANDTLNGEGGGDAIGGGSDADTIDGGLAIDNIEARAGWDLAQGGADNDIVQGDDGQDDLRGNDGSFDRIEAQDGEADYVSGGAGTNDTCKVDLFDTINGCEFF